MKKKSMPKGIIDYEPLNNAIIKVEEIISEYNNEERELIINHVQSRLIKERQQNREGEVMQNAMANLPLGLGKLMKRVGKENEGDENAI